MTTISHVRTCNPQTMITYAADLATQNATFTVRVEQMHHDVDTTMNSWKGEAAAAASARGLSQELAGNHLSETVVTLADHFNSYGSELDGYRTALLTIVDGELPFAGLTVDDDGNVTAPTLPSASNSAANSIAAALVQQALHGHAAGFQARIKTLLAQFGDTENKAAQAITTELQLLDAYEKSPDGPPVRSQVQDIIDGKTQLPSDPQKLHDFWESLTPAEKDALYRHDRFIGNHDGIPQVDRDHYNRLTVEQLRADAQHKLDYIEAAYPAYKGQEDTWQKQVDAAKTTLAGYNAISGQLDTKDGVPRLLSQVDDQGRAAIALRNPDTAGNVVTYVPGTGENTTSIGGGVDRAERMRQTAERLDDSKQTSVISWYGYNPPQSLTDATKTGYADNAAGALDSYQNGLRVTHDGNPSMNTVVGHSYGTTAIGHAASNGHTLNADKMILVASPGIGVDKPTDLNLTGVKPEDNTQHIWATTNSHDVIKLTPNFIHGPEPVETPGFGHEFHSEGTGPWYTLGWSFGAHSQYWDPGNPGLTNMGKIITGVGAPS
ncbi:alpha/beta hydrolase [Nocardia terpenica]|uniref:DUF1023 domain-containing protein n=1 Tax=Nocardia terpenica TaxID=455432 RepID=A0A291RFE9_9NOCA|nr:alpha/beta hydrolase [Nocardia terpenica]ATL65864.1 hypothetical protein CRH09_06190 [Nocardia terpenica]